MWESYAEDGFSKAHHRLDENTLQASGSHQLERVEVNTDWFTIEEEYLRIGCILITKPF